MTQSKRLSLAELNRRLIDEIGVENYARRIITGTGLKVWHGSPRTLRAGSIHGEEGASFSLILEGPKIGRWAEFDPAGSGEAEGGDLIDLTAAVYRCSIAEAAKKAREHLAGRGDPAPAMPARKEPDQAPRDPERNQKIAKKIWMDRQPIAGTLAEIYLASRGLVAPPGEPLGFVPQLKYPGTARRCFPALIAGFQQPTGEVTGILRIFLASDGRSKAPVDEPKLMLGACGGCAVRLGMAAPTLRVAEGLENGIAYIMLNPGAVVWVAGAARGFPSIWIPELVREVVFLGERQPDGEPDRTNAMYIARASDKLEEEGRAVSVDYAESGKDHNDALVGRLAVGS